jgi:hypothetical protein
LPLLKRLDKIAQFGFPFALKLKNPPLKLQLHLALGIFDVAFQPEQLLLYSGLPAYPRPLVLLPVSFHHRQHLLLQFLDLLQRTFLPPPLFFLSAAQNRADATVVFLVRFVVGLAVAVIIVGGSFLGSLLGGQTDLMGDVAFPISRGVGIRFV